VFCPFLSRFRPTVNISLIPFLSHPDLRDKAGCVSYVRQGRTTHIITECIEINVTISLKYLFHSGSLTKINDKYKTN
jgi:hypothetical protein